MQETNQNDAPTPERLRPLRVIQQLSIQDYVTFGYLYLLVMGLMTEVVYYKLLGINILYYSSVLDVLISPLSFMVRRLPILFSLLLCVATIAVIDYAKRKQTEKQNENCETPTSHPGHFFPIVSAIAVFFMFIGGGLGAGIAQSKRLESGEFKTDHLIEYVEGPEVEVRIFGQNTDFVFYAEPGQNELTAAPVRGNIRRLKPISKLEGDQADHPEKTASSP